MVKYKTDMVLDAVANPIRRQVVERLATRERMSVSELTQSFPMSLPAMMKHVAVLEESGIVVSKKEGRVRYCALNPDALAEGMTWFTAMEEMWEGRLDRLEEHLKRM